MSSLLIPKDGFRKREALSRPLRIAILGATGSIGSSALKVISENPSLFEVIALSAHNNIKPLAQLSARHNPRFVLCSDENKISELKAEIAAVKAHGYSPTVLGGIESLCEVARHPDVDVVLGAIVGMAGLKPILAAIEAGKRVALANKESLVVAGKLVCELKTKSAASIIPVDSEHSAIFQAMHAVSQDELESITLTASGGPFYKLSAEELAGITPQQAVRHPRWNMGAKISIDSATLMNKALEVIEAHWLFDLPSEKINVVIHPQSIVHSLISTRDGTMLAQLSQPDMCGPIAFALAYPNQRIANVMKPLDLTEVARLDFWKLDDVRFPAVRLARQCINAGGIYSAVLNCANEAAVAAFMRGALSFNRIVPLCEEVLQRFAPESYTSLQDLLEVERKVQDIVSSLIPAEKQA